MPTVIYLTFNNKLSLKMYLNLQLLNDRIRFVPNGKYRRFRIAVIYRMFRWTTTSQGRKVPAFLVMINHQRVLVTHQILMRVSLPEGCHGSGYEHKTTFNVECNHRKRFSDFFFRPSCFYRIHSTINAITNMSAIPDASDDRVVLAFEC